MLRWDALSRTANDRQNRENRQTRGIDSPNAARLLVADQIMGEWKLLPNPCAGNGADKTFQSQGTYILPVAGKKDAFIFMADRWRPNNPIDGRYVWLPIQFENDLPVLNWLDEWDLNVFDQ